MTQSMAVCRRLCYGGALEVEVERRKPPRELGKLSGWPQRPRELSTRGLVALSAAAYRRLDVGVGETLCCSWGRGTVFEASLEV